jgi:hypothetical protein
MWQSLWGCSPTVDAQASQPTPGYTFEILRGGGTPVCEAYVGWLRRGQPHDAASAGFNLDLGEPHFGFGEEWSFLDRVEQFLWERDVNPANHVPIEQLPQWQRTPAQMAEARHHFHVVFEGSLGGYHLASLDIDNDGGSDRVFFAARQVGSTLLVLNADGTDVDAERTEHLLGRLARLDTKRGDVRHSWPDEIRTRGLDLSPVEDIYDGAEYGVFRYESSTYLTFRWYFHPDFSVPEWSARRTLHVYCPAVDGPQEICELRVVP